MSLMHVNPYRFKASYLFQDSFTETSDTTLASHVPEIGGWTRTAYGDNTTATVIGGAGYATGAEANKAQIYVASSDLPTADYSVEAVFENLFWSVWGGGITIRSLDSAYTGYLCFHEGSTGWALYRAVAGSFALLGSTSSNLLGTNTVKLTAIGTSIKFFVNGVERISVTDSGVSGAGRPGICVNTYGRVHNLIAY